MKYTETSSADVFWSQCFKLILSFQILVLTVFDYCWVPVSRLYYPSKVRLIFFGSCFQFMIIPVMSFSVVLFHVLVAILCSYTLQFLPLSHLSVSVCIAFFRSGVVLVCLLVVFFLYVDGCVSFMPCIIFPLVILFICVSIPRVFLFVVVTL